MKKFCLIFCVLIMLSMLSCTPVDNPPMNDDLPSENDLPVNDTPSNDDPPEDTTPVDVVGDSLSYVPISEAEEFVENATLPVVRMFRGSYPHILTTGRTVKETFEHFSMLQEAYIVYDPAKKNYMNQGITCKAKLYYGETERISNACITEPAVCIALYQYALSPYSLFEATPATQSLTTLEIKEVYCLIGFSFDSAYDHMMIYFVTNHGEYIYYKNYLVAEQQYLMPASDFYNVLVEGKHGCYDLNMSGVSEEYIIGDVILDE